MYFFQMGLEGYYNDEKQEIELMRYDANDQTASVIMKMKTITPSWIKDINDNDEIIYGF